MRATKGKATPREVVHQAQVDDRVRRAMPPPSDPGGRHHASLRDLADAHGVPVAELVESWSERAACRTYLGGVSVHEAELGADLRIALANLRTATDRADHETRRADALDDLLAEMPAGDAAGARERVLSRYEAAARAAGGDGPRPVPAPPGPAAVAGVDRDGLLRPGD